MTNKLGTPVAEFELLDIQGTPYGPSDFRGQWLLLVFHRHLA